MNHSQTSHWASLPARPRNLGRRKRRGFTLVELMVTIVIVSILSTMVFLFAKRGIQAANAAKSVSNMRQIYTGVMAVTEDGVGTGANPPRSFPPYAGWANDTKPWKQFIWWDLVAEGMGIATKDEKGSRVIWNVHPKDTVFQNPLSRHTFGGDNSEWKPFFEDRVATQGSYVYNNSIASWTGPQTEAEKLNVNKMADVPYPAMTMLFGENDDNRASNPWFFHNTSNAPQGNYKNSAHIAWVDGSVSLVSNEKLKDDAWLNHYKFLKRPKKKLSAPSD